MKFNVGDKVRLTGTGYSDIPVGTLGEVVGFFDNNPNTGVPWPINVLFEGSSKVHPLAEQELEFVYSIEVGDMVVIRADLREGMILNHLDRPLEVENIVTYAGERVFNVRRSDGQVEWDTCVPERWVEKYVEPEPTLRSELQQHLTNVQGWVKEYSDYRDLYSEGKTDAYKVVAARVMDLLERFAE